MARRETNPPGIDPADHPPCISASGVDILGASTPRDSCHDFCPTAQTRAVRRLRFLDHFLFQSMSTVVPIYSMFIIGGSLLGVIFLSEPMHARKMIGITFAVISIFLIAR